MPSFLWHTLKNSHWPPAHINLPSGREPRKLLKRTNKVIDFANSFHTTIKFFHELSSESIVFRDTEVLKGPRFLTDKILDVQTDVKPYKMFQYMHFSSCHPLSVKKGFVKGEALSLLLRTN